MRTVGLNQLTSLTVSDGLCRRRGVDRQAPRRSSQNLLLSFLAELLLVTFLLGTGQVELFGGGSGRCENCHPIGPYKHNKEQMESHKVNNGLSVFSISGKSKHAELHHVRVVGPHDHEGDEEHRHPAHAALAAAPQRTGRHVPPAAAAPSGPGWRGAPSPRRRR